MADSHSYRSRGVSKQTQFNIIYIMRNMVLRHKPQYPSDLRRRNLFSTRTTFNTRDASCPCVSQVLTTQSTLSCCCQVQFHFEDKIFS